jgi:hypothetical protein
MINTVIDRMRDNPQAVADPAVKAALESLKATAEANATPSVDSEARGPLDVERKVLSELETAVFSPTLIAAEIAPPTALAAAVPDASQVMKVPNAAAKPMPLQC